MKRASSPSSASGADSARASPAPFETEHEVLVVDEEPATVGRCKACLQIEQRGRASVAHELGPGCDREKLYERAKGDRDSSSRPPPGYAVATDSSALSAGPPASAGTTSYTESGFRPPPRRKARVITEDISRGRERNFCLPCVNEIDDAEPPPFTYVTDNVESSSVSLNRHPEFRVCCDCTDGCQVGEGSQPPPELP